ncbi:MAG: pseudouridine synthase [Cyanobacteriota bacterium]|nr:pseudouridine synthase [Cyanobacteriota bacterium]
MVSDSPPERLQKLIAQHGVASRREAEAWIKQGRVTVNGQPAHLGQRADLRHDQVAIDDRPLRPEQRPKSHYLVLHKPLGMVSTCHDPEGRPTILEVLPDHLQDLGLHPVGRLDAYSTGALLITNDGDFTYRLTHPKHDIAKVYRVRLEGSPSPQALAAWQRGIDLNGRLTRPAQVKRIGQPDAYTSVLEITLWEGRNRQIRRMAAAFGYRVISLHRLAVGAVWLGNLSCGEYRPLTKVEIGALLDPRSSA